MVHNGNILYIQSQNENIEIISEWLVGTCGGKEEREHSKQEVIPKFIGGKYIIDSSISTIPTWQDHPCLPLKPL